MTKAASYSINGQLSKTKLLDQGSPFVSMSQDPPGEPGKPRTVGTQP